MLGEFHYKKLGIRYLDYPFVGQPIVHLPKEGTVAIAVEEILPSVINDTIVFVRMGEKKMFGEQVIVYIQQ